MNRFTLLSCFYKKIASSATEKLPLTDEARFFYLSAAVAGAAHGTGTAVAAAGGLALFLIPYKDEHSQRNNSDNNKADDYCRNIAHYPMNHGFSSFLYLLFFEFLCKRSGL